VVGRGVNVDVELLSFSLKQVTGAGTWTSRFQGKMNDLLSSAQKTFFDDLISTDGGRLDPQAGTSTNADGSATYIDSDGFVATNAVMENASGAVRITNTASSKGKVTLAFTTVVGREYAFRTSVQSTDNNDTSTGAVTISLSNSTSHNSDTQIIYTKATSYNSAGIGSQPSQYYTAEATTESRV
jgi:hypothetical protein